MRYDSPELIDRLAGEYVLGTLHGKARSRFEQLKRERDDVRRAVWRWESHFGDMATGVTPVTPPAIVWQNLSARLGIDAGAAGSQLGHSARFWRAWSGIATIAAAALALIVLLPLDRGADLPLAEQVDHVALIGEGSDPLWIIGANLETGTLNARAVNAEAAELDKVFELWMLPNVGDPQSIGLLPVSGASVTHQLPAGLLALLKQSKGLAISIEPAGGSPTGLPTGPVVHTAKVVDL